MPPVTPPPPPASYAYALCHGSVSHTNILQLPSLLRHSTNDTVHILVKAQPGTQSTGPRSPTRLGIRSQDLGLPDEYSLGYHGLSAASGCKLAFTSKHYTLLTATDTTALY